MVSPYPLIFEPLLLEKVWGGRRLARFGKRVREGTRIGESWEVADLGETSASGAGGGAARSIIACGPLAGRSLGDAMRLWGDGLLGDARPTGEGGFPLLVKFLDAREHLSVQVHPSEAYAAAHPGAHLKSECWYVLDAEAGSVIFKGFRAGVTRGDVEDALRSGAGEGIVAMLEAAPAVVGECHTLPSGTVHALGGGVLVAEVQTPSDTTFRVYDWVREYGRSGRSLHVEEALACMDLGPAPPATRGTGARTSLVRNDYFTLEELRLSGESARLGAGCAVVMVVGGSIDIETRAGREAHGMGTTILIPAAIADEAVLTGRDATVLCARVR